MSCGCGIRNTFSPQKDAWSCKSSLSMSNWDPYPELQNPKNCYGANVVTENYCGCGMKGGDPYRVQQNNIDSNYVPLQQSVVFSSTSVREGYDNLCCKPTPYDNLNKTWGSQKPYTT